MVLRSFVSFLFRAKPIRQKQQYGILSVCHTNIRIHGYDDIDNIKNIDEVLISPLERDFRQAPLSIFILEEQNR